MKIQTHPAAGGFVAALYYLLLVVLMYQLSCISSARGGFVRQQVAQSDHAVSVVTKCNGKHTGTGSGVLIGGRYLLTALHVVECFGYGEWRVNGVLGPREATIDRRWRGRDVARLRMYGPTEDFWGAHRPTIGRAEKLDVVCTAPAKPTRASACGWIITAGYKTICAGVGTEDQWCHNLEFNAEVARGNSGGGLYNARGQLVALLNGAQFAPGTDFWLESSFGSELWPIREEIYDE